MRIRRVLSSLIAIGFWACNNENLVVDKIRPDVEIISPQNNVFFDPGDTVFIHALFSDNTLLSKGSVHIHDRFLPYGKDTVFTYVIDQRNKSIDVDTFWIVNDPADKNYSIYFDATDVAENTTEKLQNFYQYH